MANPI